MYYNFIGPTQEFADGYIILTLFCLPGQSVYVSRLFQDLAYARHLLLREPERRDAAPGRRRRRRRRAARRASSRPHRHGPHRRCRRRRGVQRGVQRRGSVVRIVLLLLVQRREGGSGRGRCRSRAGRRRGCGRWRRRSVQACGGGRGLPHRGGLSHHCLGSKLTSRSLCFYSLPMLC